MGQGKPPSFYRSPSFRGRRSFGLDLHDAIFDPVFDYAEATAPERPIQDTIRELLLQAVANDARDGAIRGAKIQAYREAQRAIMTEAAEFLRNLADRLHVKSLGDTGNVQVGPAAHSVGESA